MLFNHDSFCYHVWNGCISKYEKRFILHWQRLAWTQYNYKAVYIPWMLQYFYAEGDNNRQTAREMFSQRSVSYFMDHWSYFLFIIIELQLL